MSRSTATLTVPAAVAGAGVFTYGALVWGASFSAASSVDAKPGDSAMKAPWRFAFQLQRRF